VKKGMKHNQVQHSKEEHQAGKKDEERRHGRRSAPTKPSRRELASADTIFDDRSA
jgi:hypothetical protein